MEWILAGIIVVALRWLLWDTIRFKLIHIGQDYEDAHVDVHPRIKRLVLWMHNNLYTLEERVILMMGERVENQTREETADQVVALLVKYPHGNFQFGAPDGRGTVGFHEVDINAMIDNVMRKKNEV